MSSRDSAIALIRDLSLHLSEQGAVLAALEDAAFFRKRREVHPQPAPVIVPAQPIPVVPPLPKVAPVLPQTPPPAPIPVAVTPPPLPAPLPPATLPSFAEIRKLIAAIAPELPILNEIPNDQSAQKIANRWKTKNQSVPISILSFQEPPEQRALLEKIAIALDIYFGPAKIIQSETIEKEKQWEAFLSVPDLKLIIVCDYTLWQLRSLLQYYKETQAQGARLLLNTPVFLLPDLSLYLKDPLLKRSLWKALCQKCS